MTPVPHAVLPRAPLKDDPYEMRAAYFEKYAPHSREDNHLFLRDGTRVKFLEDLLPAVDDDSSAALAIKEHVASRAKVEEWSPVQIVGVTLMGVGFLGLPALFVEADNEKDFLHIGIAAVGMAVVGSGLALVITRMVVVGADEARASEAADRAFRSYPLALTDRLGVTVDQDGRIVDQGGPAQAPAIQGKSL